MDLDFSISSESSLDLAWDPKLSTIVEKIVIDHIGIEECVKDTMGNILVRVEETVKKKIKKPKQLILREIHHVHNFMAYQCILE